jgi:hypothetical protein
MTKIMKESVKTGHPTGLPDKLVRLFAPGPPVNFIPANAQPKKKPKLPYTGMFVVADCVVVQQQDLGLLRHKHAVDWLTECSSAEGSSTTGVLLRCRSYACYGRCCSYCIACSSATSTVLVVAHTAAVAHLSAVLTSSYVV